MLARLALLAASGLIALLLAACNGGGGEPTTPAGEPSPRRAPAATATAEATPTPALEDQVSEAYLRYWDAYSDALFELDATLAQGVASGEELDRIREEIDGLRSQGLALKVVVEHNLAVIEASEDSATVFDEVVNNSFFVDAETKEPPQAEGSGEVLQDTFHLEKLDGQWMVVRSTRQR
ncbi:MAG: hypothetical protein Q8Q00_06790 [Dehalococcoidia bacterium]|nr:hypothetical protein [Dehalococcoidia bacterium]